MAAILGLLLLAAGAVGFAVSRGDDAPSAPPAPSGPTAGIAAGVLVKVEEDRLTLAPTGGGPHEVFGLRPIDRGRIDLFHLLEHVRQKWPVRITWEAVDGARYAAQVDDA
jgi:hypothetical protein